VARQATIIFTMVADTPDVEEVILGDGGIIEGVRPGSVVVDMSTISPSATRAMAERLREAGAQMLDAPVSGGDIGARDGTLSIMVGGEPGAFERVRPLFEIMGGNVVHIGGNGAGQVCKACNQVVVAQTITGIGEALLLAEASGVDGARVREALLGGFAGSRILEVHGRRMLDDDYAPGFKASLHQKDMRIVLETAHELGLALPGAAQVAQYLNTLVGAGDGELDSAAVYRVQRRQNGREGG
jgi:2-hydroxy-3-oxopropionate reductase